MKCRKVIDLIPLFAGSDLPPKTRAKIKPHLQNCRSCQQEYTEYQSILQQTREWLILERKDWEEPEWKKTVQAAIEKGETKRSWLVPWPFKKGWAVVLMASSAILLSLFVFHPSLVKDKMGRIPSISAVDSQPEIFSLKLVSKETGLKISWFFNKDLKLEVME
jgi:hypothetical protein